MLETIKGGVRTKFEWKKEEQRGFELTKVATQPVLIRPSFDKLFTIECDASNIAVGAIESRQ